MPEEKPPNGLLRLQRLLLYFIIVVLLVSMVIGQFDIRKTIILNYISVTILILAAPLRLLSISEYFRKQNEKKYRILSYMVIFVMALTALMEAVT
jgi:NADH:ubiquinone oxidoreductase subunit K